MNKYSQSDSNDGKNRKRFERVPRVNWNIKSRQCRLIEEGRPPREMDTMQAIDYARNMGLDLVEVGFDKERRCSVCKICDYGKYVYEKKQREKQLKKQARANQVELKNLQISMGTDTADLNRIIDHAKQFLLDGNRVRIALRFRNRREQANMELAKNVLREAVSRFTGLAVLDSGIELSGRELSCILKKA